MPPTSTCATTSTSTRWRPAADGEGDRRGGDGAASERLHEVGGHPRPDETSGAGRSIEIGNTRPPDVQVPDDDDVDRGMAGGIDEVVAVVAARHLEAALVAEKAADR